MSYAANTSIPVERTRLDLERLVLAKGAGQWMNAFDALTGRAIIGWSMDGRMIRLAIPLPNPNADEFVYRMWKGQPQKYGRKLPAETQRERWDQACRSRWRAVLLIVKAKFEAIDAGISTVEREFLADTLLANGETVSSWIRPQLEEMYSTGRMPLLLPAAGGQA